MGAPAASQMPMIFHKLYCSVLVFIKFEFLYKLRASISVFSIRLFYGDAKHKLQV